MSQTALHGTGLMQCKEWLQQVVIKAATGITVSQNAAASTGAWVSDEYEIGRMQDGENFQAMLERSGAQAGDVVQMYTGYEHTMVIGDITDEGVWVFDTNYGEHAEWKTMEEGAGLDLSDEDFGFYDDGTGELRMLTSDDIQNGVLPNRWRQPDNTVRYHFISFTSLAAVQHSTLQRIPLTTTV